MILGAVIYGVRGLGGIGKTELCRKLVAEVGGDYPECQQRRPTTPIDNHSVAHQRLRRLAYEMTWANRDVYIASRRLEELGGS